MRNQAPGLSFSATLKSSTELHCFPLADLPSQQPPVFSIILASGDFAATARQVYPYFEARYASSERSQSARCLAAESKPSVPRKLPLGMGAIRCCEIRKTLQSLSYFHIQPIQTQRREKLHPKALGTPLYSAL